jgi:hypothetical protein
VVQSRHPDRVGECPLSGVKRTSKFKSVTSAFDPKATFGTGHFVLERAEQIDLRIGKDKPLGEYRR